MTAPSSPPTAPLVRVSARAGVATLTLDSPHNRNALSTPLLEQLAAALTATAADDTVRVVVLDHTGPVFCAGVDLKETARARESGALPAARLADLLGQLWQVPKPVVARIAGPARAGGLGLVAAADIALCADTATFAFTEVRLGVVPAVISATVLRRLSPRAAARLYLTGEVFDGATAARIGLVTDAVPAAELDSAVADVCAALVRGAPDALTGTKQLLHRHPTGTVADELAELSQLSVTYFRSAAAQEGMAAFRDRRDPAWVPPGRWSRGPDPAP